MYTLSAASSPNRRISIIQTANTEELLALVEIDLNVLKSRIPVRAQQKERLKAHAASIRHLSRTRNSDSARKILLISERNNQQGKGPLGAAILLANIRRFDPYVHSSKTPVLTQRHRFFDRNKRTGARGNRNCTIEPQLRGKGGFKPSLWF